MNRVTIQEVRFHSPLDEQFFWFWVSKIDCIKNLQPLNKQMRFEFTSSYIKKDDLFELVYLFKRYKIDLRHLKPWVNHRNSRMLRQYTKAFWYKPLFGEKQTKANR